MKRLLFSAAFIAAVGLGTVAAVSQNADPYANNAAAGTMKFPLAAPAGMDTRSIDRAPPKAVNQGKFDDKTWKYGTAFNPPAGAKIWNPVKLKMMRGEKVTGGTMFAATDPSTYCAMANAGYDFIWTEHQHSPRDWEETARMWAQCPHAKAVPGVRVAYTDEREIQHATDAGALVIVVPTIRSYEEALKARDWTYFPPLGKRSQGGGQAFGANFWGGVPGGYRQGDPDYERNINIVHDAAIKAGVRLCGPLSWRDRPDFTCFQAGSETAAIAAGVKAELGELANTQPVPEAGPYAKK
jgi:hypothetical protein